MARKDRDDGKSEETAPLTGHDASINEAETGNAGSGAAYAGADRTGLPGIEDETGDAVSDFEPRGAPDIEPDRIETEKRLAGVNMESVDEEAEEDEVDEEDDTRITARPSQHMRPVTPDMLPSDDEEAATDDEDAHRRAEGDLPRGSDPRDVLPEHP